ncbi:MAG: phosphatase PAP2 family protein, partial [Gammaproteobacteria bacterium]
MPAGILERLIELIAQHPHWALVFVFSSALLESLAVVGLFVPGAVVMFGIGALVATGALDFWSVCGWSIAGAVAGDGISYWLGRHYHQQLRARWPFRRHPELFARGMDFFHRHGGKSVLLARFVGPVRPVLPAIAGMLDMPPRRFFLVNVLSACAWAPAYLLPGVAFGASLELASEVAGRLALLLFVLLVAGWLLLWVMRRLATWLQHHVNRMLDAIGHWARRHPRLRPLEAALLEPEAPESRGLFVLSLASALLLALFSWLLRGTLAGIDRNLHAYLQGLRTPLLDAFFAGLTRLGNARVVAGAALCSALWFSWRRLPSTALHLVAALFAAGLTGALIKVLAQVPRPLPATPGLGPWSFPSLHATLSAAFIGFLAVVAARALPPARHWIPYGLAALYLALMDFSRLYLGVHWFTDVLAGTGIGLGYAALFGIAYRRHAHERTTLGRAVLPPLALLLALGALGRLGPFSGGTVHYRPPLPVQQVRRADWLQHQWARLPARREDLAASGRHPLNLQVAGHLRRLREALAPLGWRPPPAAGGRNLLRLFATDLPLDRLPVMPQVHAGHRDRLRLLYRDPATDRWLLLRLWPSGLELEPGSVPVWLGNVSRLRRRVLAGFLAYPVTAGDFQDATARLVAVLR